VEKKYEDIVGYFDFHGHEYAATGDVIISYDVVFDKFNVDVDLYRIDVINDEGKFGGQQDNPMPEMRTKAGYALQDKANEIAAQRGDFDGVRGSSHPTFRDPDELEPRD
jgi:hypothetical protein